MATIIALLAQIIALMPALIAAGVEVQGLIARVQAAVASGSADPTDAMWTALDAEVATLRSALAQDPA